MVETLVAARVLGRLLNLPLTPTERPTLRVILSRWLGTPEADLEKEDVKSAIERFLPEIEKLRPPREGREPGEEGVTMKEMIELSGLTEEQFNEVYLSWVEGAYFNSPLLPSGEWAC